MAWFAMRPLLDKSIIGGAMGGLPVLTFPVLLVGLALWAAATSPVLQRADVEAHRPVGKERFTEASVGQGITHPLFRVFTRVFAHRDEAERPSPTTTGLARAVVGSIT